MSLDRHGVPCGFDCGAEPEPTPDTPKAPQEQHAPQEKQTPPARPALGWVCLTGQPCPYPALCRAQGCCRLDPETKWGPV